MIVEIVRIAVHITVLVITAYLLMERRFSRPATVAALAAVSLFSQAMCTLVVLRLGMAAFYTWFPLTLSLPLTVVFFILSRSRGLPMAFNILTVCVCGAIDGCLAQIVAVLFFGGSRLAQLVFCIVLYCPMILLILRVLKRPYLSMLRLLDSRGWLLACLPSALLLLAYSSAGLDLNPLLYAAHPEKMAIAGVLFGMQLLVYGILHSFFVSSARRERAEENGRLLQTQVLGLRAQAEGIQRQREMTIIHNHDSRHHLGTVCALLEKGSYYEALRFARSACERQDEAAVHARYADNVIVDAILAHYLGRAEAVGIRVRTQLHIPEVLPYGIDEMELSSVFANALDNAIEAAARVPEGERAIRFTFRTVPRVGFEIANTCDGEARLDESGLPIAGRKGHGIGTRSIQAFAEKYGAILDYALEDGWFRMRMLLQEGVGR